MTIPPDNTALAEALDACLDALRRGDSIDDCLSRYPDLADELQPLLTASSTIAGAAPQREDSARRMAQLRFDGAVRLHRARNQSPTRGRTSLRDWWSNRASRWARVWAVGLTTMALFVILSTGAAYASTDALPDSPLYPVKRATEHARLAITFSEESRAIYYLELIERRTLELAAIAETGDTDRVEQLSRDVLKNIEFARVEAGYTEADVAQQPEMAQQVDMQSQSGSDTAEPEIEVAANDADGSDDLDATVATRAGDARLRAYIEAERATAARAYAMLQIAHQVAPAHVQPHVLNALTLAEHRYRTTRFPGESAPISRTLFAQGIARITDSSMTIGGKIPFEISQKALGNRQPQDGDAVTVGGYIRDDGVLLVLRVYAFETDAIAEDRIWLQAEAWRRTDGHLIVPGFRVAVDDWEQVGNRAPGQSRWVYLEGTVAESGEILADSVRLLGDGPVLFPQP